MNSLSRTTTCFRQCKGDREYQRDLVSAALCLPSVKTVECKSSWLQESMLVTSRTQGPFKEKMSIDESINSLVWNKLSKAQVTWKEKDCHGSICRCPLFQLWCKKKNMM